MTWSDLKTPPSARQLRQFAAAWFLVFASMAVYRWRVHHETAWGYALGIVSTVGIAGLIKPGVVRQLFILARIAAFPIGWVMTHLGLAVVFFLILTPLSR